MKKTSNRLRVINIVLGILAIGFCIFELVVFPGIRAKMEVFAPLSELEQTLLTIAGFGLIELFLFFLLSLFEAVRAIRRSDSLDFFLVLLVIVGVVALLLVFADVSLLTDIVNQYEGGLDQPEWTLLYPILGAQYTVAAILLYLHFSGYFTHKQRKEIARDSNIFLLVHMVGTICGALGLAFSLLGFLFPRGWSLLLHSTISTVLLIFPYALTIFYWLIIKFREPDRQLYDEKQLLDVGRSAFLSLLVTTGVMTLLFVINYQALDGVVRFLWLPIFLFTELLAFSVTNLIYSSKT